jgi:serine/threonine-protein phosphatase CPPED1
MTTIRNLLKFIKKNSKICLFISFCIICFFSLQIYHHTLPLPDGKWIYSNLKNIQVKDPAHFSFAVFGGNRFGRHVFEGMLKQVDHDPDIAFAIDLGDAVLKGGRGHYHHLIKQIDNNLGIPLLTVMGDNEVKGGGQELYQKVFGPLYYSFKIGKCYFIVINNVEDGAPDPDQMVWLEKELAESKNYNSRIIFMHRPLYNPEGNNNSQYLPEAISTKLIDMFLSHNLTHLFASDASDFFEGDIKGISYTITGDAGTEQYKKDRRHNLLNFLKVHVEKDTVKVEIKDEFIKGYSNRNMVKNRAMFFLDNMITIHWLELSLIAFTLFICVFYLIRKQRAGKRNDE